MIYYVLLTHGAKPKGKVANHPAARAQIANLRAMLESSEHELKPRVIFEYSRKISGLASLPNLSHLLEATHEQHSEKVVMDNIGRLFAACEAEHRGEFAEELLRYKDHLFGLKQGGLIADMHHTLFLFMVSGRETPRYTYGGKRPRNNMSKVERQMQTADATAASRIARRRAADQKARELNAIREELALKHETPTQKMIADEANSRGLTTTRGGPWLASTVGRALKRLERPTLAEKARPKRRDGNSAETG